MLTLRQNNAMAAPRIASPPIIRNSWARACSLGGGTAWFAHSSQEGNLFYKTGYNTPSVW